MGRIGAGAPIKQAVGGERLAVKTDAWFARHGLAAGGTRRSRSWRGIARIAPIIAIQPIVVAAPNRTFGGGSG
jgi:hypothetical protein